MKLIWYLKIAKTIDIIHKKDIYYQEKEKLLISCAFVFKGKQLYIIFCFFVLEKYYKQEKENMGGGSGYDK